MMKTLKENYKRYLISALITFLSIFLPLLLGVVETYKFEAFDKAFFIAFVGMVMRVLFKALWETMAVIIKQIIANLK